MGSRDREDTQQGGGWQTRWVRQPLTDEVTYICMWINQEEQLGSETDCATQDSSMRKESFRTSGCKNLWGLRQWEILPSSQESSLERPTGS